MSAGSIANLTSIVLSLTTPPRVSARHARALAQKLRAKAPGDLTPEQRARLDEIDRTGDGCDEVIKARERITSGQVGQARNDTAQAWGALASVLAALALVAPEVSPLGKLAAKVHAALFSGGTGFAQLSAVGTWARSARLDERIREEGHQAVIESLGLGVLLANVRHHVAILGAATGCDGRPVAEVEPSPLALVEARDRFRIAVASYARSLAADVDERNPRTLDRFASALSPIDEVRVTYGGSDEEDETAPTGEPAAPAPFLPAGPETT
jgi:RNA 3'-terminal phosphate cyclase